MLNRAVGFACVALAMLATPAKSEETTPQIGGQYQIRGPACATSDAALNVLNAGISGGMDAMLMAFRMWQAQIVPGLGVSTCAIAGGPMEFVEVIAVGDVGEDRFSVVRASAPGLPFDVYLFVHGDVLSAGRPS